ncbi:MAG: formylglycine-generating enzyme family protein, partial [Verrucomicrobiota bacterium]|nr:formylglycine-generating enzyme family protein [Verrucomicrobiota bacterium]
HCRELLRWWQKKLPLKNQPSNPLAQLLRPGLEESSRYLTEARVELLDPERRRQVDDDLAAHARELAIVEFHKYLTFAIADGILGPEEEKSLLRFGQDHGLDEEQIRGYIEAELQESGAQRPPPPGVPRHARPTSGRRATRQALSPEQEFLRMLRLTSLDREGMSDETRDAFVNMAANLGIEPGDAEDLVDVYLEEADEAAKHGAASSSNSAPSIPPVPAAAKLPPEAAPAVTVARATPAPGSNENLRPFTTSAGAQMLFIPAGTFVMGSDAVDAGPNERPLTRVTLSRYYISRFPITNAEYEQFDPAHARKRSPGAGDRHPVVYVSSLEAMKYCQWLSTRERKKYRLPTEAEWEFAARGSDGRRFPWGNHEGRGDLGNFADRNTVFAWSDREINDGYPESSPVGAFPLGVSSFGVEDMAGNVWEWCLDYFETYRGTPRANPRGATSGAKRVYRGGSWKSRFNSLRASARGWNVASYSCNDLGFRIVCEGD